MGGARRSTTVLVTERYPQGGTGTNKKACEVVCDGAARRFAPSQAQGGNHLCRPGRHRARSGAGACRPCGGGVQRHLARVPAASAALAARHTRGLTAGRGRRRRAAAAGGSRQRAGRPGGGPGRDGGGAARHDRGAHVRCQWDRHSRAAGPGRMHTAGHSPGDDVHRLGRGHQPVGGHLLRDHRG